MKNFLKEHGLWVLFAAAVIAVALAVMSVLSYTSSPLVNAANTVAAPFRAAYTAVADWFNDKQNYYRDTTALEEENAALRRQLAEMEDAIRQAEADSAENARLRELLNLREQRRDITGDLEAALITYNPTVDENGYVVEGGIVFPEIPLLREDVPTYGKIADSTLVQKNGAYARNGLGVIAFPVYAGSSYYVNACGSKMSLAAIAFETEAVTVKVSDGTNEIELYTREAVTTAVENVEAVKVNKVIENGMLIIEKNGVRYNALGQKL